jgi:hypothetical protein
MEAVSERRFSPPVDTAAPQNVTRAAYSCAATTNLAPAPASNPVAAQAPSAGAVDASSPEAASSPLQKSAEERGPAMTAPEAGSCGSGKRVNFQGCQVFSYDADLAPAAAAACALVEELPLEQSSPTFQAEGAELGGGQLASSKHVGGASMPSRALAANSQERGELSLPSQVQVARNDEVDEEDSAGVFSSKGSPPVATSDNSEVTPVLYLDILSGRPSGLEGAQASLSVTSAQALGLSEEDLHAMHERVATGGDAPGDAQDKAKVRPLCWFASVASCSHICPSPMYSCFTFLHLALPLLLSLADFCQLHI